MLDNDKTLSSFGYAYDDLSVSSSRPIFITCDYCETSISKPKKVRVKSNSILDKDACNSCKFKKREELSILKYGVKNSSQIESTRERIKQSKKNTNNTKRLEKYKKTMLEKYGVDNIMNLEVNREKMKVDNPMSRPEVKEKARNTSMKKFGKTSYLGTEECRTAFKSKYGVDNASLLPDHLEKSRETSIEKFGAEHFLKVKENAAEHGKKVLQSKIDSGIVKLYDGRTISSYVEESGFSDSRFRTLINTYGFDTARSMTPHVSSLETVLAEILPEYKKGQIIGGYKPDFVVGNIIIEADGLYWHSDKICQNNKYHFEKRVAYQAAGYTPLFFREDEIRDKLPIVKSIIDNKLGKSERIFARKCLITEGNTHFFSINHLMGGGSGKVYALEYDGEVVAGFQVKRISGNNWELSRFSTKLGINVIGGFSRLFKEFIRDKNPDSLLTFIDMRYGMGSYLTSLNFIEGTCYPSFKWTDFKNTFPRTRFLSNSGYENGLSKIWDCGQKRFTWYKGV